MLNRKIIAFTGTICYPCSMTDFFNGQLYPPFLEALNTYGITQPTPVQKQVIPLVLEGKSVFFELKPVRGKLLPSYYRC